MTRADVRVLHVLEALEGGTARHLVDVVRHTAGVHHEVAIPRTRAGWVTDEQAAAHLADAGAVVHVVDMRRAPIDRRNLAAAVALRKVIAERRPRIVHGHSSVGGALARVAAWRAPSARVYTPNGLATSAVALRVERFLGRRTDCLIAVSESEAELARRLRLALPDKVRVIANGVDTDVREDTSIDLRDRLGVPKSAVLVGSVARLVPQKAPEIFVRTCAAISRRLPDVHFLLVGAGPLQGLVDGEVARGNLGGRWHQIPVLPEAGRVLGQLDVFVLLSRFEGLPYTPLEAMRSGTPVVLSRVVGSRDIVEDGRSGLLVPPEDPPAAANAVVDVLTKSDLSRTLGDAGRRRISTRFDVRSMGLALRELYRELACGPDLSQ